MSPVSAFLLKIQIFGALLIYGLLQTSASYKGEFSSLNVPGLIFWVFAICFFGVSSLGIFATCCESIIGLKLFASFMGIGMIIMLYCGITVARRRHEIETAFRDELQRANLREEVLRSMVEGIQSNFHCCGLTSPGDWVYEIPDSCKCSNGRYGGSGDFGSPRCQSKPQGIRGPDEIYEQPCIIELLNLGFNILFGFFFGFAIIALLGLLIAICMINQIKSDNSRESMYLRKY